MGIDVEFKMEDFDRMYLDQGRRLSRIYGAQKLYNDKVKRVQDRSHEEWIQTYLMGMVSEVNEVLREMNWKLHRNLKTADRPAGRNIAPELADITKYVLSLWLQIGYNPRQILEQLEKKQQMLDQLWLQEFREPPRGCDIIIADLDGTLADFRAGFYAWVAGSEWEQDLPIPDEDGETIHMDVDYSWDYHRYEACKDDFENNGGYGHLPAIDWAVKSLAGAQNDQNSYVVVYTARPHDRVKRVWMDSWEWLKSVGITPDELHMGSEDRVHYAISLRELGNRVVMFEDNPAIVQRAVANDIVVAMPVQKYNKHLLDDPYGLVFPCEPRDLPDWSGLFDVAHGKNQLHLSYEQAREKFLR